MLLLSILSLQSLLILVLFVLFFISKETLLSIIVFFFFFVILIGIYSIPTCRIILGIFLSVTAAIYFFFFLVIAIKKQKQISTGLYLKHNIQIILPLLCSISAFLCLIDLFVPFILLEKKKQNSEKLQLQRWDIERAMEESIDKIGNAYKSYSEDTLKEERTFKKISIMANPSEEKEWYIDLKDERK